MSNGRAKSVTVDSPLLSLIRIALRVGLERAEKTESRAAGLALRGPRDSVVRVAIFLRRVLVGVSNQPLILETSEGYLITWLTIMGDPARGPGLSSTGFFTP